MSLLLLAPLSLLSCKDSESFQCADDSSCSNEGIAGECQSSGYCSFPDPDCASGQRYGEFAEGLAQQCVPPAVDVEGGVCGDGIADAGEVCDGADLAGASCADLGFASGVLSCTADCQLDAIACSACGNGAVDQGEECDGDNLGAVASCQDVGLGEADEMLACTTACTLDYAECSACGDGQLTDPEQCDGTDLGGRACADEGFDGGTLACSDGCTFDVSGCSSCGNGVQDPGEECDGAELGGNTCEDLGFAGGPLGCDGECLHDTSNCSVCGNGAQQDGEACDGLDLGQQTCQGLGFVGGTLSCDDTCDFDVSACDGQGCGNGQIEPGEDCDGEIEGLSCQDIGSLVGPLSCSPTCEYDESACGVPTLVQLTAGGSSTDEATLILECDDGSDICLVDGSDGGWNALTMGCTIDCSDADSVTVTAAVPEGALTIPNVILVIEGGAVESTVACAGANPCTTSTNVVDELVFSVVFIAVG